MNERLSNLVVKAKFLAEEDINKKISSNQELNAFAEKFLELLVQDTVTILRQEWYDLNNIETKPSDTPRDIGIRVGAKGEIIKLMHKIPKHYGLE